MICLLNANTDWTKFRQLLTCGGLEKQILKTMLHLVIEAEKGVILNLLVHESLSIKELRSVLGSKVKFTVNFSKEGVFLFRGAPLADKLTMCKLKEVLREAFLT